MVDSALSIECSNGRCDDCEDRSLAGRRCGCRCHVTEFINIPSVQVTPGKIGWQEARHLVEDKLAYLQAVEHVIDCIELGCGGHVNTMTAISVGNIEGSEGRRWVGCKCDRCPATYTVEEVAPLVTGTEQ